MQEALEKWDLSLLSSVCPQIVGIIRKIDIRFRKEMKKAGKEISPSLCIILDGRVHMAELATYVSHAINGVAALHTEILRKDVFAEWYKLYPERFQNKTNGITQRRWLGLCNPELCALIESRIGSSYITDLTQLEKLDPQIDSALCKKFITVKKTKKKQLCEEIAKREGVKLDPSMVFDVQVKRLHEYKRQFMNALSILAIYDELKKAGLRICRPLPLFSVPKPPLDMTEQRLLFTGST